MGKQPAMTPTAQAFSDGLYNSGYFFQYMKVIEIVAGLFLLINRYTALFVLVLFPISLNIFLFHTISAGRRANWHSGGVIEPVFRAGLL
jgi:putative oxidoreductase